VAGKRFPLLISPAFEAATKKHLSGVVEMNITVSPKGTTDGIEILSGDPRLAPYARSVAMVFFISRRSGSAGNRSRARQNRQ
jgi:hypothetical protein